MNFGKWILVAGLLITTLIVAVVAYMETRKDTNEPTMKIVPLNQVASAFLDVLPADLTVEQRTEIEGLLQTFYQRAGERQVQVEDQIEVDKKLRGYTEQGTIDRPTLNRLMAEISFYAYRLDPEINPPDSSGMHPLLIEGDSK